MGSANFGFAELSLVSQIKRHEELAMRAYNCGNTGGGKCSGRHVTEKKTNCNGKGSSGAAGSRSSLAAPTPVAGAGSPSKARSCAATGTSRFLFTIEEVSEEISEAASRPTVS